MNSPVAVRTDALTVHVSFAFASRAGVDVGDAGRLFAAIEVLQTAAFPPSERVPGAPEQSTTVAVPGRLTLDRVEMNSPLTIELLSALDGPLTVAGVALVLSQIDRFCAGFQRVFDLWERWENRESARELRISAAARQLAADGRDRAVFEAEMKEAEIRLAEADMHIERMRGEPREHERSVDANPSLRGVLAKRRSIERQITDACDAVLPREATEERRARMNEAVNALVNPRLVEGEIRPPVQHPAVVTASMTADKIDVEALPLSERPPR